MLCFLFKSAYGRMLKVLHFGISNRRLKQDLLFEKVVHRVNNLDLFLRSPFQRLRLNLCLSR